MVDFQSRDTRRGPTTDDESESESDASADSAESSEADASGTPDATEDTTEGDEPDTDTDSAANEEPLTQENASASAEPADADPLAADPGPGDAETGDGSADTGASGAAADTGRAETEANSTASQAATPTRSLDVAVVTVADDRAALEDTVTTAFESAGHAVVQCERLRGGYDGIQQMVDTLVDQAGVDVVVTVGGVGLAADEMAIEAVHPLLEKALPGFGEAFRSRLADHIGTGIVGVRSTAGVSDGTLVFCLPGDAEAAELAVREILATEAPILLAQLGE